MVKKSSKLVPLGLRYYLNSYKYDLIIGWSTQVRGYLYLKVQGQGTQDKQAPRLAGLAQSIPAE